MLLNLETKAMCVRDSASIDSIPWQVPNLQNVMSSHRASLVMTSRQWPWREICYYDEIKGSVQRQNDMSCRKCDLVLLNIRCFLVAEDFTDSTWCTRPHSRSHSYKYTDINLYICKNVSDCVAWCIKLNLWNLLPPKNIWCWGELGHIFCMTYHSDVGHFL